MNKNVVAVVSSLCVCNILLTSAFALLDSYNSENVIKLRNGDVAQVGMLHQQKGIDNIENSPYYPRIDFYNSSPTSTLIKLDKFKTYQQTTGYSCGATCCLMALNYFGIDKLSDGNDLTEAYLIKALDSRSSYNKNEDGSYGTSTKSIVSFFETNGYKVESSLGKEKTFSKIIDFANYVKDNLSKGNVILCESVEYGGHWMVIVGYDDMGQPENSNVHTIVFADPCDVNSHWQDGYLIRSAVRFFSQWYDKDYLSADQKNQQYVMIVNPKNK